MNNSVDAAVDVIAVVTDEDLHAVTTIQRQSYHSDWFESLKFET